jgi:hypothetical protein
MTPTFILPVPKMGHEVADVITEADLLAAQQQTARCLRSAGPPYLAAEHPPRQEAAGSLISAHGDDPVAFEADHLDEALGQGWNVLIRGHAHRVLQPGELQHLRHDCDVRPWTAGEYDLYVRIVPDRTPLLPQHAATPPFRIRAERPVAR